MAKKNVKRPVKKPKKASSKPVSGRKPRKARTDPYKRLLAKIDRIKERVPYIEPTGECIDESTGEVLFRYTEAQHVFKVYREECAAEGLIYRPYFAEGIRPNIVPVGRGIALVAPFCIEDIQTGARIIGWGTGMGDNGSWSANTASTRALKQYLLTTFEANWEDPENPTITREQERQDLKAEVMRELEADGTLANIESIRFWASKFGKPKEANKKSKKKETQNVKGK